MAKILIFKHDGWDVACTSWTAASKNGETTIISYTWGDSVGWFDTSTGSAKVEYNVPFATFLKALMTPGEYLDMRGKVRT